MNVYAKVWQGASCTVGNARICLWSKEDPASVILVDFHQVFETVQILIRVDVCHACDNV